ncbi:hypothetical protein ACJD0Z_15725 [Flavobacteriaceae bacterium M23B6Z8]
MKKKELKNLSLSKRTISKLGHTIKGGTLNQDDQITGFTNGTICDVSVWLGCRTDECGG